MKVELREQGPVRRTLEIEVEPEEIDRETRAVVRGYATKARIPGFRPGKAPLDLVRARFDKEVREDVRERVLQRSFLEATRERGLRPIGDPVLDEVAGEEGEALRFKVSFEVLPEFEIKGHREVEVRRPAARVEETDVDKALEEIRQARARLVAVEGRAAEVGDVVVCDVAATPDGGEPFSRERIFLEVSGGERRDEVNSRVAGAAAGDERAFTIEHPADHPAERLAGRRVDYRVRVHEVKARELPALDDDFAKDLGDFDSLAALRERVRADLEERARGEAERVLRQRVLDKVLLANPVVLPDSLVEDEIRHRLEDFVRGLVMQGVDPEKANLDWERLRQQVSESARKSVHARLVLDSAARIEGIAVGDDEIDARIRRDAATVGEKPERVRAKLEKGGGYEVVRAQLVREKTLDLLTSVANIQDEE